LFKRLQKAPIRQFHKLSYEYFSYVLNRILVILLGALRDSGRNIGLPVFFRIFFAPWVLLYKNSFLSKETFFIFFYVALCGRLHSGIGLKLSFTQAPLLNQVKPFSNDFR